MKGETNQKYKIIKNEGCV